MRQAGRQAGRHESRLTGIRQEGKHGSRLASRQVGI